jgi:hypothetical protein
VSGVPRDERQLVVQRDAGDHEGFYWPGTGAQFRLTKETRALVDKMRPELSADQKAFVQCETP